jgi:hypothetical protein
VTRRGRLAAALAVSAVVSAACTGGTPHRPQPSAGELAAYEKAILPIVQDWGSIEVEGMQPAVDDLRSGTGVPAVSIGGEARAWRSALQADRAKLAAVSAPPGLSDAPPLFDRSISAYLDAAQLFGRAAAAPAGPRRNALIDAGVAAAKTGDRLYDAASALIQAAHRRLGQSPSPDFPNR